MKKKIMNAIAFAAAKRTLYASKVSESRTILFDRSSGSSAIILFLLFVKNRR